MNFDTLLEAQALLKNEKLRTLLVDYDYYLRLISIREYELGRINENKCKYVTQEMYDNQLTLPFETAAEVPPYIVASYLKNNYPDLYCKGFVDYATKLVQLEDLPIYQAKSLELQELKKEAEALQENIMEYLQ